MKPKPVTLDHIAIQPLVNYLRKHEYEIKNEVLFHTLYPVSTKTNHYDLLGIDDTQNAYGNLRVLIATTPAVLLPGMMNDHIVELLRSRMKLRIPLLFVAHVNNDGIEEKMYQTEDI